MNPKSGINRATLQEISFDLFLEIGRLLDNRNAHSDILTPVLMILADQINLENALITIFEKESKEIYVESSYGLSSNQKIRGKYQLGEGVIGEVVRSGQMSIIKKITDDPRVLYRVKGRPTDNEFSFICVPIVDRSDAGVETVTGTLSMTLPYSEENDLEVLTDFLKIISHLLVDPIIIRRELTIAKKEIQQYNMQGANTPNIAKDGLVGTSKTMKSLKHQLYQYTKGNSPLFITGERGSGKTQVAYVIHNTGPHKEMQLVRYNGYITLPEDAMEILFGNDKDTPTVASSIENNGIQERESAIPRKKTPYEDEENTDSMNYKLIEKALNGTLLIEEVETLPVHVQKELVHLIQTEEMFLDGKPSHVSIRFIFTSEYTLEQLLEKGKIVAELYEELQAHTLSIPPLRERKEDTILLADYFLQKITNSLAVQMPNTKKPLPKRLSTPAIDLISRYHWPGNLNELYHVIEDAAHRCEGGVLHAHLFPPSLQSAESTNTQANEGLTDAIDRLEKDLIIDALKSTRGHLVNTAKLLQISGRILGLRIKKHRIIPKKYR